MISTAVTPYARYRASAPHARRMPKCVAHSTAFVKPTVHWRHRKSVRAEMSLASSTNAHLFTTKLKGAVEQFGGGSQTFTDLRAYAAKASEGRLSECQPEPFCMVCDRDNKDNPGKKSHQTHHCLCTRRKRGSSKQWAAREEMRIELNRIDTGLGRLRPARGASGPRRNRPINLSRPNK